MKLCLSAALLIGGILAANASQAVITAGPQNLTINAGSTADFTVTATNATTYQWMFQGPNMLQPANLAGATNSGYEIDDTGTNQAGVYSVIVGSTGTNLTNSATLTVLQGTIINFRISGFPSGPSNVLVELFDYDKPATVQNFIHYVISGSGTNVFVPGAYSNLYSQGLYSNMFFDRLIPGFVLQGGGWVAQDRTNSMRELVADPIDQLYPGAYLPGAGYTPSFPEQVDSEFFVGPKVSNRQGTLAMALPAGSADGASDAFFFNLADNPALDVFTNDEGPFTVFGRVVSGSNVLQYFNNPKEFSKPKFTKAPTRNIFTNGIFDYVLFNPQDTTELTDLPINYHSTNWPANSNLFFVDFTFPDPGAQPVIDTTPPTAAITFPPANSLLTNGTSLTVQGTAQDDVGLARVYCSLDSLNGAYDDLPGGGNAAGTTNWSLFFGVVEPGIYTVGETPQDGAGNLGNTTQQDLTITAVLTNGVGTVSVTNLSTGSAASDAVGANLLAGTNYVLAAQPGPGWLFDNWQFGTNVSLNPNLTVTMNYNTVWTANFISNTVPGGIAFSYPAPGGNTTNGSFSIQGEINGLTNTPIALDCRLFSYVSRLPVTRVLRTSDTTNWSFAFTNLPLGHYFVQVIAQDTTGQATIITNDFTAGLPIAVLTAGNGRGTITTNFNGQFLVEGQAYSMKAAAAPGSLFDTWSDGVNYTNSPVVRFTMTPGLVLTATFVSNDFPASIASPIAFTYPAPLARLTAPTFDLTGTLNPALVNPVVSFQLFYGSNSTTPPGTNVTITPGAPRSAWTAGLTNLAPGYYSVVATVTDSKGRSALISESFQVLAQLILQVTPTGAGTLSSNWTGPYVSVGVPYTVTARSNAAWFFAYWSNNAGLLGGNSLKFIVTTNETITANFITNYFYYVAGTYNGLFYPTDGTAVSAANSGYFTLTVTTNGAIPFMSLSFPGTNLTSQHGAFPLNNPSGTASAGFYWTGLDGKFVTNYVNLDLAGGSYSISGVVTNAGFSATLLAVRAATNLTAGSVVIPGTNVFWIPGDHSATNDQPGGDGYGSLTLAANGAISLIGRLADNTSFSQSTQVSTNFLNTNAIWPFYASLYGGKGIILGWLTNTAPASFEGEVAWSKPANTNAFYTNAFLVFTNAGSAAYVPPVAGTRYQIAFGGASLTNGLTNTLTLGATGLFTVDPGQTNNLALAFNPKSGVLSGSFSPPFSKGTNSLFGAFVSPSQGGSGYFLDTNSETGFFEIAAP